MAPILILTALLAQAALPTNDAAKLADPLRALLVRNLPEPLYVKTLNWGHKKPAFSRIHWKGKGVDVFPEVIQTEKEDGEWTKFQAFAVNPGQNLRLTLTNVQHPEDGKMTFGLQISMPVRFVFERQIWKAGVRLYSGSAQGRLQLALALQCESTASWQKGALLPVFVFRLRVTAAQVACNQLVLEHVAGFGGAAAEVVGKLAQKALQQWRPSLERDLLSKANTAICKAADAKEVRIGLDGLKRSKH
jgi:hypothetical protein